MKFSTTKDLNDNIVSKKNPYVYRAERVRMNPTQSETGFNCPAKYNRLYTLLPKLIKIGQALNW